jgi:putative acetyltransferase
MAWLDRHPPGCSEIRRARSTEIPGLIDIWERSVRATHDFLTEDDIVALRPARRGGAR